MEAWRSEADIHLCPTGRLSLRPQTNYGPAGSNLKVDGGLKVTERRNSILNWLKGSDPSTNFIAARKKHEEGTGDWWLRSKEFQSWETGCTLILWL
jgi:hypothetical protein